MNIHRSAHVHDTKRKQRKEATTRSAATAPTRCDTQKGGKTKSPFCVVLKTYHLTGIRHKTCLKHSNFLNRKLCPIVTNMEHHGNSKGTGNRRKNKIRQDELRQSSKHANYNMPPRLIGRDPELRPVLDSTSAMGFASFSRGFKSWANKTIAALNRIAMSGTHVNTRCANKGNKINRKTLREERETTTWITTHGST